MSNGKLQVNVRRVAGKKLEVSARGNRLIVDQVYAEGADSPGFRPTELLLGALGACTMGTVLTFCENMKIPIDAFAIDVEGKRETAPERISEIQVSIRIDGDIPPERVETLKRVAHGCRVHYTITHQPKIGLDLKAGKKTA